MAFLGAQTGGLVDVCFCDERDCGLNDGVRIAVFFSIYTWNPCSSPRDHVGETWSRNFFASATRLSYAKWNIVLPEDFTNSFSLLYHLPRLCFCRLPSRACLRVCLRCASVECVGLTRIRLCVFWVCMLLTICFLLVVGVLSASFVVFARSDVAKTRKKKSFKRNSDCAAVMLHFEDAGSKWRKKVCRVLTAQVASGTCHCMIMCLFFFFVG